MEDILGKNSNRYKGKELCKKHGIRETELFNMVGVD